MRRHRRHRWLAVDLIVHHRAMLLLELTASFALLPLNPLTLLQRQHLLVLHPQLATLKLKMIQMLDDRRRFVRRREIGKCEAPKYAVIEVVVERIRQRQAHLRHEFHQLLLFHRERYVFDDDCGRDELLIRIVGKIIRTNRLTSQWGRADSTKWTACRMQLVLLVKPGLHHESVPHTPASSIHWKLHVPLEGQFCHVKPSSSSPCRQK